MLPQMLRQECAIMAGGQRNAPHLLQVKTAIMSLGDLLSALSVVSVGSQALCRHTAKR